MMSVQLLFRKVNGMKFLGRSIPYAVIIVLVLAFSFIYGCSGDSASSNSFNELLKLVPSNVDMSQTPLILIDYSSFYEDNDISLTTADGQPISFQEYIELLQEKQLLTSAPIGSYITGYGRFAVTGPIRDKYVGYNFTDVDAEIQAGAPPDNIVAAIGRFDPQAISDALSHQDEWPAWAVDAYTVEEYRGVTIHSWGDGFEIHLKDSLAPPHIDELGRARPLAVTNDYLFYAANVETIKLMIDASQDKAESLTDLPEYAEIVGKISGMGVYSVTLGNESWVNGDPDYEGIYPGPRLKKFLTFGSGTGQDTNGYYEVFILYHENRDDAESNISLLEQRIASTDAIFFENPWSELITNAEIEVDRQMLVAKLYPARGILMSLIYGHDILLLHEE
jgi:hypothetical protein